MSKKQTNGYVVYGCERLRDGLEEWARCFDSLEKAVAYVNGDYHGRCNTTMQIFELGKEIELETVTVEEPQPAKTKTRFKVK